MLADFCVANVAGRYACHLSMDGSAQFHSYNCEKSNYPEFGYDPFYPFSALEPGVSVLSA